jgi:hypothetical protein
MITDEAMQIAELERTLRELVDRDDIGRLISGLGAVLDERRLEDLASIVADDVVAELPFGTVNGVDGMREAAAANLEPYARTQHVLTNYLIDLDGDAAIATANLIAVHVLAADDPSTHFDVGGAYRFEAIRSLDGWRLSRVHLRPIWVAGAPPARA